jgi:hypothetical protein
MALGAQLRNAQVSGSNPLVGSTRPLDTTRFLVFRDDRGRKASPGKQLACPECFYDRQTSSAHAGPKTPAPSDPAARRGCSVSDTLQAALHRVLRVLAQKPHASERVSPTVYVTVVLL